MQSQQSRRFGLKLMKICEAQIKTPLTTGDKASMQGVFISRRPDCLGGPKNPEVFRSGTAFVLPGGGLAYV
ncbi:hypothetical protein, partial [Mesorhizobium sp.]|uniref:hypothetical protein n=1 Tax=Mesorhizobium sp. TaxID=1871066 RepID=UPI0025E76264